MLKRFALENFTSFNGVNYLDLTAGRTETHPDHVVDFKKVKILKSAVIYGANASGKSNLIKAITFSKNLILNGLDKTDTYKKHFRLDIDSVNKPTSFEYQLEINDKFFSYGFQVQLNDEKVVEEWLYEINSNSDELIFHRKPNTIELGKSLTKEKDVAIRFSIYVDDMKNQENQLFLSEIANKELNIESVKNINEIFLWFKHKLLVIYPNSVFGDVNSIDKNKDLSNLYKKYLNLFDTGVVDISSIEESFENNTIGLPEDMLRDIIKDLKNNNKEKSESTIVAPGGTLFSLYLDDKGDAKIRKLGLVHGNKHKDIFELKEESDGTRRLFDLIPLISRFNDGNFTVIIDEFDRSLHPKLTRSYFELFYHLKNLKSQLIVTTHESTLLDLDLVRRDEIWFVEKDEEGSSKTYPLSKFKVRYDSKVNKAYLLGRYGAVPMFNKIFDEVDLSE